MTALNAEKLRDDAFNSADPLAAWFLYELADRIERGGASA